jgi:hypothetical protein
LPAPPRLVAGSGGVTEALKEEVIFLVMGRSIARPA